MRILPMLASLPLVVSAIAAWAESPTGQRFVIGGPPARQLYQVACEADAGPWLGVFSEEHFNFLGSLSSSDGTRFQVAFISTIWGQAGRATNRLLIFTGQGKYLGRYSGLSSSEPPSVISSNTMKFPVSAEYGNEVSFNAGPLRVIRVDGELHQYEPANPALKRTCASSAGWSAQLER